MAIPWSCRLVWEGWGAGITPIAWESAAPTDFFQKLGALWTLHLPVLLEEKVGLERAWPSPHPPTLREAWEPLGLGENTTCIYQKGFVSVEPQRQVRAENVWPPGRPRALKIRPSLMCVS